MGIFFETVDADGNAVVTRVKSLLEDARSMEQHGLACVNARTAAEAVCKHIVTREEPKADPTTIEKLDLETLIGRLKNLKRKGKRLVPLLIEAELRVVQQYGNLGAHDRGEESVVKASQAFNCLNALSEVVRWFSEDYLKQERVVEAVAVPEAPKSRRPGLRKASIKQLRRLRKYARSDEPEVALMALSRMLTVALTGLGDLLGVEVTGKEHLAELHRKVANSPGAVPKIEANALDSAVLYVGRFHDLESLAADAPDSYEVKDAIEHGAKFVDWFIRTHETSEEWLVYVGGRLLRAAVKTAVVIVVAIVLISIFDKGR